MIVRFLDNYKQYHKGDVANVTHALAKALIQSGKAKADRMMTHYKVTK